VYDPRTYIPFIETVDFRNPRTRLNYPGAAPVTEVHDRLPGETDADLTTRLFGSNTAAARGILGQFNPTIGNKVTVPKNGR